MPIVVDSESKFFDNQNRKDVVSKMCYSKKTYVENTLFYWAFQQLLLYDIMGKKLSSFIKQIQHFVSVLHVKEILTCNININSQPKTTLSTHE